MPDDGERGPHPVIDGRPVLLGDWLHASDPDSNDLVGNTFTLEGQVRHISMDYGGVVLVLAPQDGLPEEFHVASPIFRRTQPPASGNPQEPSDG